jgi:hypothetical protein
MSAHSEASSGSQDLCQKLYELLSKCIPGLHCKQTKRWCALFKEGSKRFAYINHRKKMKKIEVWCSGDVDELSAHSGIHIIPRDKMRGGWEEGFPARIIIEDDSDIIHACDLLFNVSFRSSQY